MNITNMLEDELESPSVFIEEDKLSPQYLPENLLFRTDELKTLVRHFKSLFKKNAEAKRLVIYGKVGTGKTSVAKKFALWAINRENNEVPIFYNHVNCRIHRTPYTILLSIVRSINTHIPTRGFSYQELMSMITDYLEAKKTHMLLVLDEIDFIQEDEISDILYMLTRTNEGRSQSRHHISLILIARTTSFLHYLDDSAKSTLSAATMELKPYSEEQLRQIMLDRINESFKPGAILEDTIQLAVEISGKRGDARQALELLWYAGKYADQQLSTVVYPEYIRVAKSRIEPALMKESLNSLDEHKLLLLLGILRKLRLEKTAHITTGMAKTAYLMACEEHLKEPRKQTQIWEYLNELERLEIIKTTKSGRGYRGNTRLISVEDASVAELEKEVCAILDHLTKRSQST